MSLPRVSSKLFTAKT